MTMVLEIALVVMTLLSVALGFALYKLTRRYEFSQNSKREYRKRIEAQCSENRRYASGITRTLNEVTGGISKRISESRQIIEAVHNLAPELFRQNKGLIYWLHANDQFLMQLYSSAAEGLDESHRRSVHNQKSQDRESIFAQAYERAGLQPPTP